MLKGLNVYVPVLNPTTGFGYLTVKLLEAIDRAGVRISNLSPDPYIEEKHTLSPRALDLVETPGRTVRSYDLNLMVNVPQFLRKFEGKTNIAFTMFESARLPELFVRSLNYMDFVFVPCTQNVEAFKESGVQTPIAQVPFGNDQEDYHFLKRDWEITDSNLVGEGDEEQETGNPFTFLHIGEINWRKGGDLALKAFKKVFPPHVKDVRIAFKFSRGYTPDWYLKKVNRVNDERIVLLKEPLTMDEMRSLYGWTHCFIGCSRGEGWGLLAWQALATGCPAIVTDWGGCAEYAHLAMPLDYTMKYHDAVYYGSEWGLHPEPSLDDLCALMENAYKNPMSIAKQGEAAARTIAEDFTWDHSAMKLLRRLEGLHGNRNR